MTMPKRIKPLAALMLLSVAIILSSCETEDPGPLQVIEKEYSDIDFDRLEMGSAFNIHVTQSNTYGIHVRGDRRNVDDLIVSTSGSTLNIRFNKNVNRVHETYITITMPALKSMNFSGASDSKVDGFEIADGLDVYLSGASVCQFQGEIDQVNLTLSGASSLHMTGLGDKIKAEISGASVLSAFGYSARQAIVNVSGASTGKISVMETLNVVATGASSLLYRGNPAVTSSVSGASEVHQD